MASEHVFDDLNLSTDEVKRLGEALKDEQFRKLLVEYAEEISNPENKRKAEEEIAMMESERGMNVQFVHPAPGYVLKTTVDGSKKAFINICQNDKIDKPKSERKTGPDGKNGLLWKIPHSFAPPKEDLDKTKKTCQVFDVVFHPDTYRMAMKNERFKKLVEDTALEGIERQFGVTLDKNNIKRPKLKFKGTPVATVIRERKSDTKPNKTDPDDILNQMPYPYDSKTSAEKAAENEAKHLKKKAGKSNKSESESKVDNKFTEPKYTITHLSHIDMSEYRNAPDAKTSTRPKELVIKIELPLLSSAAQANLDIFEKKMVLTSVAPAAYKLDLSLPYPVNEDEGSAKFDKAKRTLTVTLPVLRAPTPPLPFADDNNAKDGKLIEVLSGDAMVKQGNSDNAEYLKKEPNQSADVFDNEQTLRADIEILNDNNRRETHFPQNVKFVLPEYLFSQDNETVSFVIRVKNIEAKSVKMFFPQNCIAIVQFISYGAGCFPVYYCLYVRFPGQCRISSEHCSVDVSNDNLVFLILKHKSSRGLWDSFEIGAHEKELQTQQFLTESNLQRELSDLDKAAETSMPVQVDNKPELTVVKMDETKLTIDIKPPKSKKYKHEYIEDEGIEDEEYDPPSSAEIEVVHKHPAPNLHSILKARSPSESSEEVVVMDPESPRSEGEELSSSYTKKRSVSFSNHVDRASFKSFASVSSMTPALKSKRRRQRKREEKKNGRVRRTSEGTSSSEECLQIGDSYSFSEGETSDKLVDRSKVMLSRTMSDPGPNTLVPELSGKKNGKKGKKGKKLEKGSGESESIPQAADVLDFRTSKPINEHVEIFSLSNVVNGVQGTNGSCAEDHIDPFDRDAKIRENLVPNDENNKRKDAEKNKKIISEIKNKLAGGDASSEKAAKGCDSDDDDFVDAVSSMTEEFDEKVAFIDVNGDVDKGRDESGGKQVMEVRDEKVSGEFIKGDKNSIEGLSKNNVKEKPDVETMLSWEECPQVNGGEHVTQCDVEFTNTMIYELDFD
ncbi:unnamed protein product [Lymnaea stagnalis]|uniref:Protein kintoun n=1 Tax=Lymnaea stagnalis TaxID=6523 RepID=A0AAV2HBG7_LYMST